MRQRVEGQPPHPRGRGIAEPISDPAMSDFMKNDGSEDRQCPNGDLSYGFFQNACCLVEDEFNYEYGKAW